MSTAAGEYAISTHLVDVNDGQLTLQLFDLGGTNANVVINALEVIVAGPDRLGPQVIDVSSAGSVFGGTDRITLTFNEAIDANSFGADDVSLVGPTGPVGPLTVTRLGDVTYEVAFVLLQDAGQYQLLVGPEITDLAGNQLDQDKDGTGGELPEDQLAASSRWKHRCGWTSGSRRRRWPRVTKGWWKRTCMSRPSVTAGRTTR